MEVVTIIIRTLLCEGVIVRLVSTTLPLMRVDDVDYRNCSC
jgi:hypothetical protein